MRQAALKASFNTGLGTSPGGGDTDGGANTASGNGSQHRCENVVGS
jgi:hypothetical protein